MKLKTTLSSLLCGVLLAGCVDLELTDPNQRTTDTFWKGRNDALQGINAAYRGLQDNGTYGRWLTFAYDLRSDIGHSRSPWGDLANFTRSVLGSYDFEVNREIWQHHYRAIFRANQVIANVPAITAMDATLRDRVVGEAKFVRALLYFNLVNLYGNVPVILDPSEPTDRPNQQAAEQVWAQIEKDLTEARAVLPASYTGDDRGRATRWAATALLGRAHLQQREWPQASQMFADVIANGGFRLLPSFGDNFTMAGENSVESIFEVQFSGPQLLSAGSRGQNILKMIGPCGVGFCDGEPTEWYFNVFQQSRTATGEVDPRLDATLFYNKPGGMDVYGRPFAARYPNRINDKFWKKYGEHWVRDFQDWDNAVNFKVMRLGQILLLQAEALNEQNQSAPALALLNEVRARAGVTPVAAGLTQAQMRDMIMREQLLELGLEHERFLWLKRQGWLGDAGRIAQLRANDPDFNFFEPHRALLPIPVTEVNLNPNVKQNPGW